MAEALLKEKLARRGNIGVDVSSCGLQAKSWNPEAGFRGAMT